ncbi:MAG TPA: hypothetical protein VGN12_16745 [Pirellulales bacterium]|jgi:hypothetical protein
MFPKKGTTFPKVKFRQQSDEPYAKMISTALREELGETHRAAKTVMRWTGANERTVRNWLSGTKGPSGEYLVTIIRHSDSVFDALLHRAGRDKNIFGGRLTEAREGVRALLTALDRLVDAE